MLFIMKDDIVEILKTSVCAPSGENCQPWKFKVDKEKLTIFNVPERDLSLYNYKQRGSIIANGALIENIKISALEKGYEISTKLFPDIQNSDLIAEITFNRSNKPKDFLYKFITKRCSNRKAYNPIQLSSEQKKILVNSSKEIGDGEVKLITDKEDIKKLGYYLSISERLIFENKYLHDFFFDHIRWTKEDDDRLKNGFYYKTLELNDKQLKGMKFFKSWTLLRFFNFLIKASKIVARDNAIRYSASSAIGVIVVPTASEKDYINAGRILQQVWLKVTSMNLSMQPVTGILFFMHRIIDGEFDKFSEAQIKEIQDAHDYIKRVFGVKDGSMAMLFRIGDGGEPSARSSRFEPEIEFID